MVTPLALSLLQRLASVPLVYVLLWTSSVVVSVSLIVLMRTRWGQSRPLHRCAALSLLVHLLLACLAMTVRIVAGGSGGGEGPPIRVRIVSESAGAVTPVDVAAEPALAEAPPLLEPPPELTKNAHSDELETSKQSAQASLADKVVDTDPKFEGQPTEKAATKPSAPETESIVAANRDETAPSQQAERHRNAEITHRYDGPTKSGTNSSGTANTPPPTAAAVAGTPQAATPYALRTAPGRLGVVEQQGGSGQTEAAVGAALRWLAAAQSRDGRWDANQFGAGQEQMVLGHNRGGAGRNADTGISALALLAFLGAGHSHQYGEYQETVRQGLDFLIRSQAADGSLFGNATLYAQMYCHSMATFALAEAYAMTGDRRFEPAVTKAVQYCLVAQHPTTGGWRYRPGDTGDTSQLGWQLMALASARQAGLYVPAQTWTRIDRFLQGVRRGTYGGLASYRPDSPASTSMTAEALYCRLLLGEITAKPIDESAAREASAQLLTALPNSERINLYYWYYATLALHHRLAHDARAAADWDAWNDALTTTLIATQVAHGRDAGSWDTNTVWGGYGGRVYTTAMAAMCLEVYYRYAPAKPSSERWTATRPGAQAAAH
jgi:hypothetical protein